MKGIVFDIQRSSLHDGPGIRTTIFMKGCPLRCQWCHNPESWKKEAETDLKGKRYGKEMSVDEILKIVELDRIYYETSGGGVTISGGEPMTQSDFSIALLRALKLAGIHTCLDTSGFFKTELLGRVLPHVDLFHFDYKCTGEWLHRKLIGVSQKLILQNLENIAKHGTKVILRCPIIEDMNDSEDHFEAIRELRRSYPNIMDVDVLPYHPSGNSKYEALGLSDSKNEFEVADREKEDQWRTLVEAKS